MTDETSERSALLERPDAVTGEAVYSNFDHMLIAEVVSQLEARPGELRAQHAAWDFCGWVWHLPDGRWINQVWYYGTPVEDIIDDSIQAVIDGAIERYGAC